MLGYSRYLWGRFYPNQKLAAVFHRQFDAFAELGGVPEEVLYDRMKTVVAGAILWVLARMAPWSTTRRWSPLPTTMAISRELNGTTEAAE